MSSVATVVAVAAGVRAGICMIALPTAIRSVVAAIQAIGVTASVPYASDVQTEWNPSRSASCASATAAERVVVPELQRKAHVNDPTAVSASLFPPAYLERRAHYRAFMDEHVFPNEGLLDREDDAAQALARDAAGEARRRRGSGRRTCRRGGRHRRRLPLLRLRERGDRPLALGAARLRLPGSRCRQRRDPAPVRHPGAEGRASSSRSWPGARARSSR